MNLGFVYKSECKPFYIMHRSRWGSPGQMNGSRRAAGAPGPTPAQKSAHKSPDTTSEIASFKLEEVFRMCHMLHVACKSSPPSECCFKGVPRSQTRSRFREVLYYAVWPCMVYSFADLSTLKYHCSLKHMIWGRLPSDGRRKS